MTKADLVKGMATHAGITHAQAEKALESLVEDITSDALLSGNSTTVPGLGTFKKVTSAARTGRNPKTGETIAIPASTKLVFKMSSSLKK